LGDLVEAGSLEEPSPEFGPLGRGAELFEQEGWPALFEQGLEPLARIHLERGVHSRLDGKGPQDVGAERMDRSHLRPVEPFEKLEGARLDRPPSEARFPGEIEEAAARFPRFVRLGGPGREASKLFQGACQPLAHLRGGFFGEGRGGELVHPESAEQQPVQNPFDEEARFPGPRAGDDDDVGREIRGGGAPVGGIRKAVPAAHSSSSCACPRSLASVGRERCFRRTSR